MPEEIYFGGIGSVIIDEAGGDFTTPLLTINKFAREGNTWPQPQAVTDGLSNDQEGPTGQKVPFAINGLNLDAASVDTVRGLGFTLAAVDVRFVPKASGAKKMTLLNVILRVEASPINEFGKYGFVRFEGEAVSAGSAKAYNHTV